MLIVAVAIDDNGWTREAAGREVGWKPDAIVASRMPAMPVGSFIVVGRYR